MTDSMKRIAGLVLVLVLLLLAAPAWAHKVNLFAFVESGVVYCESYFADGRPVIDGKVLVYDSKEHLLLQGRSDRQGQWQFDLPQQDELVLVVDAGMGHRGEYRLRVKQ